MDGLERKESSVNFSQKKESKCMGIFTEQLFYSESAPLVTEKGLILQYGSKLIKCHGTDIIMHNIFLRINMKSMISTSFKKFRGFGAPLWCSGLRIWHCPCSGSVCSCGPWSRTSTGCQCSQKKKKKKKSEILKLEILNSGIDCLIEVRN